MDFSGRTGFGRERNRLDFARCERIAAKLPLFDLSVSNPSRAGLLHDPASLARAFGHSGNVMYDPDPRGIIGSREMVASRISAGRQGRAGATFDPERLYLCASTSEAYGWLFKLLCDPGDAILVPRPGYPLFDHLAGLEAVRAVGYRLEYFHPTGWRIDLDSMRQALEGEAGRRVRAIVLIHPNNPTGSYVGVGERRAILELCAAHDIALIVDEVFFDFRFDQESRPYSFLGEEGALCFVLDGLSKRLCLPQAKLGWIAVSGPGPEVAKAMERLDIIADAYLSAGTPVMNALGGLFTLEDSFKASVRQRMCETMAAYAEVLGGPDSPHRILRCEGGWTAIIESPRFLPEEETAVRLLSEEGLFAHPGFFFDMERELHFAFSLILDPAKARDWAVLYRTFFERVSAEG
jgi:alanine-synthesizing transaminase